MMCGRLRNEMCAIGIPPSSRKAPMEREVSFASQMQYKILHHTFEYHDMPPSRRHHVEARTHQRGITSGQPASTPSDVAWRAEMRQDALAHRLKVRNSLSIRSITFVYVAIVVTICCILPHFVHMTSRQKKPIQKQRHQPRNDFIANERLESLAQARSGLMANCFRCS